MMARYPYKPLKLPHETRILTILPGEKSDPVVCNLTHLDLESHEPFEALSYCWSKSIVHPLDLDDKVISTEDPLGEPGDTTLICARDLLGVHQKEYIYIKFGGTLPDGVITCNGYEVPVGGELLRALDCIRDAKEPLRLWVDALCINQDDIDERNEHVKMMTSIYTKTIRVRVWLGDVIGLEWKILQLLDDLGEIFSELKEKLESSTSIAERQRLCKTHPKWNAIEWAVLAQFMDRAWFERVWVVQEVANARQIVFQTGQLMIPWQYLSGYVETIGNCRLMEQIPHPSALGNLWTMTSIRKLLKSGSHVSAATVPNFLAELRNFKCTIPSDKIYGVLSILGPDFLVDVDYSKPAETLFTKIAIDYLQTESVSLLYRCGEPHHPTSLRLPSWVPDWTRPQWTSPFFTRGLKYNAAGEIPSQLSIDTSSNTIRVKGRFLDAVDEVNNEADIPITQYDPYDWIILDRGLTAEAVTKMINKKAQRKGRDADENMVLMAWPWPKDFSWEKYDNMWRTYICNRLPDNKVPDDMYGLAWENHIEFMFDVTANEEDDDSGPYHKLIMSLFLDASGRAKRHGFKQLFSGLYSNQIGKAHKGWCYNRRFFISEAERYGWAVDGTLAGDKVAIIYGGDFPFLLRDAGDGTYKIVGDCYIHGLMDGEALGDEFEEVDIVIS
ncbi:hypothetical protein F5Y16DRAFT_264381 [Xylariaceae sp. FL0255]|nr:hypothetical protein F5Y16DRAFT_264381 [Xylariaceae sp. FL0255]